LVVYIIYINDAPSSKYHIMKYICSLESSETPVPIQKKPGP